MFSSTGMQKSYKTYFSKLDALKVQLSFLEDDLHACKLSVNLSLQLLMLCGQDVTNRVKIRFLSHQNKCFLYVSSGFHSVDILHKSASADISDLQLHRCKRKDPQVVCCSFLESTSLCINLLVLATSSQYEIGTSPLFILK